MNCRNCGIHIEDDIKFCGNCGCKVIEYEEDTPEGKNVVENTGTVLPVKGKRKNIGKKTIALLCIITVVLFAFFIGNTNSLSGTWEFVYSETEDGDYRKETVYDGACMKNFNDWINIYKIEFKRNGTFVADCFEKNYYDYYDEIKLKGTYEVEDNTVTLIWGSYNEGNFEFERKGSIFVLSDGYRYFYYR